MKKKSYNILKKCFSVCAIIAILGGVIIFASFIIAMIIGDVSGENLALFTKNKLMPQFIRITSIAVLIGLVHSYLTNKHAFSIKKESNSD